VHIDCCTRGLFFFAAPAFSRPSRAAEFLRRERRRSRAEEHEGGGNRVHIITQHRAFAAFVVLEFHLAYLGA